MKQVRISLLTATIPVRSGILTYGEASMPDFILMTQAALLAGLAAETVYLALASPRWSNNSIRLSLGWTLGLGLGFYVGCHILGVWPNWPPLTVLDRWLVILLPATILLESIVVFLPGWMMWILRSALAALVTPTLLYGTIYLADIEGPGTREWPFPRAVIIMLGLAGILILVWALLEKLQARTSGPTVGAALFLSTSAAGVAVMLSGYTSGGQVGISLAGALAGATMASFLLPALEQKVRCSGFGVVGLFSILLVGRFFGTLSTLSALCLLLAPLAGWIMECPGLRNLNLRLRTALRLALVAIPLVVVVSIPLAAEFSRPEPETE